MEMNVRSTGSGSGPDHQRNARYPKSSHWAVLAVSVDGAEEPPTRAIRRAGQAEQATWESLTGGLGAMKTRGRIPWRPAPQARSALLHVGSRAGVDQLGANRLGLLLGDALLHGL